MKRVAVISTMCLVLLAGAGGAAAEPYVIRPVSTLTLDFEGDIFRFEGSDFAIDQDAAASVGIFFTRTPDPSCDPCRVGDTFDPGFRMSGDLSWTTDSERLAAYWRRASVRDCSGAQPTPDAPLIAP